MSPVTITVATLDLCPQALTAIYAAARAASWGNYAARQYCQRRNTPPLLYQLAAALQTGDEILLAVTRAQIKATRH